MNPQSSLRDLKLSPGRRLSGRGRLGITGAAAEHCPDWGYVEKISGTAVFHCDRMDNELRGLMKRTMAAAKEAIKEFDRANKAADESGGAPEGLVTPKVEYKSTSL